jgi:hypothetical protein
MEGMMRSCPNENKLLSRSLSLQSGWEKAEAEAVALKQQLDTALQQKLATEDRAAHLDGALKECMKQLRHVREEQDQLLHDTLVKKTREYDKLRVEMETKLAEASQILSQTRTELLESRAEGKALSNALQVQTTNTCAIASKFPQLQYKK